MIHSAKNGQWSTFLENVFSQRFCFTFDFFFHDHLFVYGVLKVSSSWSCFLFSSCLAQLCVGSSFLLEQRFLGAKNNTKDHDDRLPRQSKKPTWETRVRFMLLPWMDRQVIPSVLLQVRICCWDVLTPAVRVPLVTL
jgi:hypothetical protein